MEKHPSNGYTLVEVIIIIVVLSVLSTLAIQSYSTTMESINSRQAVLNLRSFRAAERVYVLQNGVNPLLCNPCADADALNVALNTNIVDDKFDYSLPGGLGGGGLLSAQRVNGPSGNYRWDLTTGIDDTPACGVGTCPNL